MYITDYLFSFVKRYFFNLFKDLHYVKSIIINILNFFFKHIVICVHKSLLLAIKVFQQIYLKKKIITHYFPPLDFDCGSILRRNILIFDIYYGRENTRNPHDKCVTKFYSQLARRGIFQLLLGASTSGSVVSAHQAKKSIYGVAKLSFFYSFVSFFNSNLTFSKKEALKSFVLVFTILKYNLLVHAVLSFHLLAIHQSENNQLLSVILTYLLITSTQL